MPPRIAIPARSISVKLAAGPAKAIQAERRGYRRCQVGSNGALAQPNIQPPRRYETIGTTTIPRVDLRMWGIGLSVTWPPSNAVRSPPILAASACDASWHVVENRKTMYQMTPSARSGVFIVATSRERAQGLLFFTLNSPAWPGRRARLTKDWL